MGCVNMAGLSPKAEERARKNLASIFAGLSSVGQTKVADALGVVESTVSKMKGDELTTASRVMGICGLKVVPDHYECVDPKVMEALITLSGMKIDSLRRAPSSLFEDSE